MRFLVFFAAVLRAVHKFQGLLRAGIASAGNDHRLGANEAPPAIISVFLGEMLTDIIEQIEKAGSAKTHQGGRHDGHRRRRAAEVAARRHRPQPHAARSPSPATSSSSAPSSSNQSIASPNVVSTSAVAESLDYDARPSSRRRLKEGKKLAAAVKPCCAKLIKENKRIIFNGNNYSEEWHKEAAKRGLLNLRTSVEAYPEAVKPEVIKAFESTAC